jgi:hypothetical protein
MKVAELKTKETAASVAGFLKKIADPVMRRDCETLVAIMKTATKAEPRLWGAAIVGFGNVHLKYESGRELEWFAAGFSPRKSALTLYLMSGLEPLAPLLKKLGPHKTGKGCLYIKRLDDVDLPTLKKLIGSALSHCRKKHPATA